ncbi:MAG: aminopeptidase [Calditrichaeota bacterium]|nr:aminopeptidase [Calditrichota bacterium]HQU72716.1 aminopeptidase [Calditrichia bacterium]
MNPLHNAARTVLMDCMALKNGESVLVVTDPLRRGIGEALREVAAAVAGEVMYMEMNARDVNGAEPPAAVATAMCQVDVVICPTTTSLTHTKARRDACAAGARVGTMPGITEEIMIRTMQADYHAIAERTHRIAAILGKGREAHVTTPAGTDIRLPIGDIHAIPSTGMVTEAGKYGNLPSGEAYLMPREGESEGVIVVDGSLAGIGIITGEPVRIVIKKGMAVAIEGGEQAKKFEQIVNGVGQKARNLAELGVGTNDRAEINGTILEDEKVMGTVHLALGNNMSMGGTCDVGFHVDGVLRHPTLTVDGEIILKDGKMLM